jgi:hypothetical protein
MYDRVVMTSSLIMEHWLEGNANPPEELITAYLDAVDAATDSLNANRLHEQVIPPNSDYCEDLYKKFGLAENKKKILDSTPDLF